MDLPMGQPWIRSLVSHKKREGKCFQSSKWLTDGKGKFTVKPCVSSAKKNTFCTILISWNWVSQYSRTTLFLWVQPRVGMCFYYLANLIGIRIFGGALHWPQMSVLEIDQNNFDLVCNVQNLVTSLRPFFVFLLWESSCNLVRVSRRVYDLFKSLRRFLDCYKFIILLIFHL